jgi:beta-glucosidase
VHGNNNVSDAVVFPHNIGLGATRDAALVTEIGQITALELRGTSIDWTFAPAISPAQNERWGRTLESFS